MCASDRNLKGGKGEGRGAAEARVPRRVRVSATHSVECSVRVCARSARRRHVRGAAHGAWAGGAKADASSKRQISQAAREHGCPPARAGGPPRARITKATRRYGPKSGNERVVAKVRLGPRCPSPPASESRNEQMTVDPRTSRTTGRPGPTTVPTRCTRGTGRAGVGGPPAGGSRPGRGNARVAGPGDPAGGRWYRTT